MTTPDEFKGLYKLGGVALMVSGLLFLSRDLLELITGPPPSNGVEILAWTASEQLGLAMTSEVLFFAAVFLVPAVIALYHSLAGLDIAKAATGCGIFAVTIPIIAMMLIVHGRLVYPVYGIRISTSDVAELAVATFYGALHAIRILLGIATIVLSLAMKRGVYGLIWSRIVREYLLGERAPMTDLMAWNADTTRMPARMHSEYLRDLFLDNKLASGQYRVDGRPIALTDVRLPVFCVATETDHVAPWRSVYKLHLLTDTEITFVLTSGGHNVGVVNPPSGSPYSYRFSVRGSGGPYVDPDAFLRTVSSQTGSWWPAWQSWLEQHSGPIGTPPPMGSARHPPLYDAPGNYVLVS